MGRQKLRDLAREIARRVLAPVAGGEIEHRRAGADLGHQRVVIGQERRVLVIPQHHVPVGADHAGAERVVGVPQLHVGGIGRIADVERVEDEDPGKVALGQAVHDPPQPVGAHGVQIGQDQARRLPFGIGQRGGADLDPVLVVQRAVGERQALGGVDLARVTR
jgi:hypothetical protein